MRRMIISALAISALCLTACSAESNTAESKPTASAPTFDRDAALRESWEQARDTYSADLKLSICEAAKEGGAASVGAVLTGEDMPFVVEHPEYDARQWAEYCASN